MSSLVIYLSIHSSIYLSIYQTTLYRYHRRHTHIHLLCFYINRYLLPLHPFSSSSRFKLTLLLSNLSHYFHLSSYFPNLLYYPLLFLDLVLNFSFKLKLKYLTPLTLHLFTYSTRHLSYDQVKTASRLEEEFQVEVWGVVEGGKS